MNGIYWEKIGAKGHSDIPPCNRGYMLFMFLPLGGRGIKHIPSASIRYFFAAYSYKKPAPLMNQSFSAL